MSYDIEEVDDRGKKVKCLSCGAPVEGFFCGDCHMFLPLSEEKDYFMLLEMERRPYIDPGVLKEKFLSLSEMAHPDKYFNASPEVRDMAMAYSSLINKAYSTLIDPKERLKYLVSLEMDREAPVAAKASMETMEFFIDASDVCNEADRFIKGNEQDPDKRRDLLKKLQEFKTEADKRWNSIMEEIKEVDSLWVTTSAEERKPILRRLVTMSHELSYLAKLKSILNEVIIGLC